MTPTPKRRVSMYQVMRRGRYVDDVVHAAYLKVQTRVFHMGKNTLPGEKDQSFGQEPCAVGACAHLSAN
jgi:acetoin:2,6-dichlorophenolindophenol oxidoreductase subunit alpha